MTGDSSRWWIGRLVAGVLLLGWGGFAAYGWFHVLGPARRMEDPEWLRSHSREEWWRETGKRIIRQGWFHDAGLMVWWYADKAWAERIVERLKPGQDMGCAYGHTSDVMEYITNQDPGSGSTAWLTWWRTNGHKPQIEWIEDGFRARGFDVEVPPSPEHVPILLSILARSETGRTDVVTPFMKYNAYRCLRDSGFEPVGFALSNRHESVDMERGLLAYAEWDGSMRSPLEAGVLPFAKREDDWSDYERPAFVRPAFQMVAHALIFGPLLLGTWLVRRELLSRRPRPSAGGG
jgi:hypothetical protein